MYYIDSCNGFILSEDGLKDLLQSLLVEFPLESVDQVPIKSFSAVLYKYIYYISVRNDDVQGLRNKK